jgi:hypothetical protein
MGREDADMARPRILAPVGRPASRLVGGVRGDSPVRGGWCAFDTNPSHARDDFTATLKAGGKGPKAPGEDVHARAGARRSGPGSTALTPCEEPHPG